MSGLILVQVALTLLIEGIGFMVCLFACFALFFQEWGLFQGLVLPSTCFVALAGLKLMTILLCLGISYARITDRRVCAPPPFVERRFREYYLLVFLFYNKVLLHNCSFSI